MKHCLIFVVCIFCFLTIGCKKKNVMNGVPYRPKTFPEILVPFDGAIETRYLSPETGKIVEGAYLISFWINEEYPARKCIEQIQNHFQSQECVRVEWTPDDYAVYDVVVEDSTKKYIENPDETQELREGLKQSDRSSETQWRKT